MKKLLTFLAVLTATLLWAEPMDWSKAEIIRSGFRYLRIDKTFDDEKFEGGKRLLKGAIIRVDLKAKGLKFTGTPRAPKELWGKPMPDHKPPNGRSPDIIRTERQTTPNFLKQCRKPKNEGGRGLNMIVAVNSTPWTPWEAPYTFKYANPPGLDISDGVIVVDNPNQYPALFVVWKDGHVSIEDKIPAEKRGQIWLCHTGFAIWLKDGKPVPGDGARHPRTAYGISQNGRYLYILALDGRQNGWSNGANAQEVTEIMQDAGAWDAINMDGGGSTTLCYWNEKENSVSVLTKLKYFRPTGMNIGIYIK